MKLAAALLLSLAIPLPAAAAPAPLPKLVEEITIPYDTFTLPNGLRVVVHSDKKAPIISVGVWYHTGSRNEPVGKKGYAHLFEHLMFYGSEHSPESFFTPLERLGASDFNGTTDFDRTNYFETVPAGAFPSTLFLESDRMGWLLPALDQTKLDAQRAIVLNEKYQGDNQPYGLVRYEMLQALFPPGHPMHIAPIGLVRDLDRATLQDVRRWFTQHYGPNNAVLVLAGDIDMRKARPLVEEMFGNIPPGPVAERFRSWVPERQAATAQTMSDVIATPRIARYWVAPAQRDDNSENLQIALAVLADGETSRLYQALVRNEGLAVDVSGGAQLLETAGISSIVIDAAPGVSPDRIKTRLTAILADFRAHGPSADEVQRVATRVMAGAIRSLERVGGLGGKGATLAEGALFEDDPAYYKTELARFAAATPESVRQAADRWLRDNAHEITILPGKRTPVAVTPQDAPLTVASKEAPPPTARLTKGYDRQLGMPKPEEKADIHLPRIERATLKNGMQVVFARRTTVPVVRIELALPLGVAGDDAEKPGLQSMLLALLDEGTDGALGALDGPEIIRRLERLGAQISAGATLDETRLSLNALSVNLKDSLALFADIVRAPTFPQEAVERVRMQALTGLKAELSSPGGLAYRVLPSLLYGPDHPYGRSFSGSGTQAGLKAVTRADLQHFHASLVRQGATFFVVGDTSLEDVLPLLERAFGDWKLPPARALPNLQDVAGAKPGIILIDRPEATQSLLVAGAVLPITGRQDILPLSLSNDILGGLTSSRLFQELREKQHWSYGASSSAAATIGPMPFILSSSVESNHTADALLAARQLLANYETTAPATADEISQAKLSFSRSLSGELETGGELLHYLSRNALLERPDNYLALLPARIAALSPEAIAKAPLPPAASLKWIIVGNRAIVEPQLKEAGLSWSVMTPKP